MRVRPGTSGSLFTRIYVPVQRRPQRKALRPVRLRQSARRRSQSPEQRQDEEVRAAALSLERRIATLDGMLQFRKRAQPPIGYVPKNVAEMKEPDTKRPKGEKPDDAPVFARQARTPLENDRTGVIKAAEQGKSLESGKAANWKHLVAIPPSRPGGSGNSTQLATRSAQLCAEVVAELATIMVAFESMSSR